MITEIAKTRTVKVVETVRPEVTRVLPEKYFETSYHGPLFSFDKYRLYNVSALMTCLGPSANNRRFQPVKLSNCCSIHTAMKHLLLKVKKTKKAKSSFFFVELLM